MEMIKLVNHSHHQGYKITNSIDADDVFDIQMFFFTILCSGLLIAFGRPHWRIETSAAYNYLYGLLCIPETPIYQSVRTSLTARN